MTLNRHHLFFIVGILGVNKIVISGEVILPIAESAKRYLILTRKRFSVVAAQRLSPNITGMVDSASNR